MTFANQPRSVEDATIPDTASQPGPRPTSALNSIFVGPNGLRAGWRLLIFFAIIGVPATGLFFIARTFGGSPNQITLTPLLLGGNDAFTFVILCIVTWIMGRIEHRKFSEYGLPLRQALRKDFWVGSLLGFLAISGTLLAMFLLRGFRITGLALHGTAIWSSLIAWGVAFLLVGLFEEFAFRGYVQYTLASGIGFWPAALAISSLFGLSHLDRKSTRLNSSHRL